MILNSDLPRSIASWSEVFDGEPIAKKSRLDAMFQNEQRRIDDAWFTMELIASRLKEEIVPAICAQVTEQVREAVLNEVRGSIADELRSQKEEQKAKAAREYTEENLITDVVEQVRSTVAREASAAVLEDVARDRKDSPAPRKPASVAAKTSARLACDDIPGVIDFVLAEERQRLNNYKFELSACP